MSDLQKQYKKHYDIYVKIAESVNNTSQLINELGELPATGVDNIDNLYYALHKAHTKVIEVFIPIEDEGDNKC